MINFYPLYNLYIIADQEYPNLFELTKFDELPDLEDNERWSHQMSWSKSSTTEMTEINKHKDSENVLLSAINEDENINSKKAVPLKENYNGLDEPNNMKGNYMV